MNYQAALALVIVLGAAAQWLAWRARIPSILLLLAVGFLAGPVFGWIDPDQLFGKALLPIISIAVAIILFESRLTLEPVILAVAVRRYWVSNFLHAAGFLYHRCHLGPIHCSPLFATPSDLRSTLRAE